MKSAKPNCYECRWRGHLEGNAHSKCCHPYNKAFSEDPRLKLFAVFADVGRVGMPAIADKRLKIKANPTGVRNGWFHYPFNFDPVWLERCEGFEKLKKDSPRVVNKHLADGYNTDYITNCEEPYFCEECPSRFKCFTECGKEKNV